MAGFQVIIIGRFWAITEAAAVGINDPAEASSFRIARDLTGIPTAERSLSLAARKWFDVYAMILPFKVRVPSKSEADEP